MAPIRRMAAGADHQRWDYAAVCGARPASEPGAEPSRKQTAKATEAATEPATKARAEARAPAATTRGARRAAGAEECRSGAQSGHRESTARAGELARQREPPSDGWRTVCPAAEFQREPS